MTPANVALAIQVAAELLALANKAVERGDDITEEELAAAFARKNDAMKRLRAAGSAEDGDA